MIQGLSWQCETSVQDSVYYSPTAYVQTTTVSPRVKMYGTCGGVGYKGKLSSTKTAFFKHLYLLFDLVKDQLNVNQVYFCLNYLD